MSRTTVDYWHTIIPSELTLDNYRRLLFDSGFSRALINSFVVCTVSVLAGLAMSAMAAYALSVFRFPARNLVFAVIVISFMIPFEAIAIPLAQQFTGWGLGQARCTVSPCLPAVRRCPSNLGRDRSPAAKLSSSA